MVRRRKKWSTIGCTERTTDLNKLNPDNFGG